MLPAGKLVLDAALGALFALIILAEEPLYEALLVIPVLLVLKLRDILTITAVERYYRERIRMYREKLRGLWGKRKKI